MCEDIPPSNYLENGELKGASIEILQMLWKVTGVSPKPVKVVPWARGYHSLQADSGRVLFSMTRTPQREEMFKWVGPIFTVRNVLLGLSSANLSMNKPGLKKSLRIGVIKDDVAESMLLEQGFDQVNLNSVSSLDQNFEKLKSGRIDLVAHTENTLDSYIAKKGLNPSDFKVYQILSTSPNYFAFSRDVPDEWIVRFQKALDASRKRQDKILSEHGLSK
jgi:polar amino acid transport system substrate-binding protein